MDSAPLPLADGFPPAARAEWLALVEKTLKGAGVETLVGATADGAPVLPLYTPEDLADCLPVEPRAQIEGGDWDVRAAIADSDPAKANARVLEALGGGAHSVLLTIASGAQDGVEIAAQEDLARVLEGVMSDIAPVALDAGFLGPTCAAWLDGVAKASPTAPLAFHMDPLSAFAAAGVSPGPIEAQLSNAAQLAPRLADTYPAASLFLASGVVAHEAGASPAWELAFAVASAIAYAKAMVDAGLSMDQAFSRQTLGLAVEAEPIVAIAKLRAARIVWGRITGACGVWSPARVEARSSRRMLTRADRWTNLVRLTSAGFAAAVGGADAVVLGAFTDAIGPADAFAQRMARNTQLILMEEAHLGRVADPAAGCWALEAQTTALARAAWTHFVVIEAEGGVVAALRAGLIARAVAESRSALRAALASRERRIIGVTDFVATEADDADTACPPLVPIRLETLGR